MVAPSIPSLRQSYEEGAEIVQLAFSLPLLFVLVMGVVQLCLMAFFTLTLAGETDQAAWEADIGHLAQCSENDANEYVKRLIVNRAVRLTPSDLHVENARFSSTAPYAYKRGSRVANNKTVYSEDKTERFEIRQLYREVNGGLIEFDVSYKLPSFINLPGLSNVTITRHVAHERIASTRTEIR